MKKQVLVIHGAGAFARLDRSDFIDALQKNPVELTWFRRGSGDWKANLETHLGEGYEVLSPKMPDADNPNYEAWKVWFEKILSKLDNELILVGHSLGGAFVLKYCSEEKLTKKIEGLFAVAAPYLSGDVRYGPRGFTPPNDLSGVMSAGRVFLYYSKDDPLVDFENCANFKEKLPKATYRELDGRGHFNKDDFPEIVEDIKSL